MRDQRGSQAIEYTLMVTGAAFALVVGLGLVGASIQNEFTKIAGYMGGSGAAAETSEDTSDDSDFGDGDSGGDSTGDGLDDILLVAQRADGPIGDKEISGVAYIVFGSSDLSGIIDTLQGDQDVTIMGPQAHALLSSCLAGPDVNGDGTDDILLVAFILFGAYDGATGEPVYPEIGRAHV